MKFEELSIKDLKDLLEKKSSESSSEISEMIRIRSQNLIDKSELVELCQSFINNDEIEPLLKSAKGSSSKKKEGEKKKTNQHSKSSSASQNSSLNFEMDQLSKMSPEQLKYQASCIRKDPSAFRASQPALFHLTDTQILQAASQMEMMASNPSAFQAMQEQVKNMTPEQRERLQQAHTTTAEGAGRSRNVREEAEKYAEMSPEQMKYRAECMRKHPEIVRASNPMMASLSDAEICAAADQMEAMASSNPNFMKEMSDYVSSMPPEERALFQKSMESPGGGGGSGVAAASAAAKGLSSGSSSPSASLPDMLNLSEAQIEMVVKSFKSNPEMTKRMLRAQGMMTDEQINKQYDFLCSMDEASLKSTLHTMLSVQKYLRPLTKLYESLNKTTGGYGGIILGAIGAVLVAVLVMLLWRVVNQLWYSVFYKAFEYFSSSSSSSGSAGNDFGPTTTTQPQQTVVNPDDEFEF
jgi:flagellar biosynthesis regulator FlbT